MPNRSELIARLKAALVAKDMLAMQLAMVDFPDKEEGPREAFRILSTEVPEDIRAWWLVDECDQPHHPIDLEADALPLVEHLLKRHKGET